MAAAAAVGGGGLSVMGASLYAVMVVEAILARRSIGNAVGDPPDATGWYGADRSGPAVEIALLGDSSAAGYGVGTVLETPGAHLASGLAEATDARVHLRSVAFVGAQTRDLTRQIDKVLPQKPQVAVILVGVNDITHRRRVSESVRLLGAAVRRLREAGCEVVVGTCPDLGTIEPIAPPLRQFARTASRRLAAAQTMVVVENGGRTVSLASILAPEFATAPSLFFGPDRFHPSAMGYAGMASVLLPSVLAALDVVPEEELVPEPHRGEAILPIGPAAVEAVRTPGTEIDATDVGGATRGTRGRWVQLRRRRRQPESEVQSPQPREQRPAPQQA